MDLGNYISWCSTLRAGTVSELMKHAKYYLQLPLFQKDWVWSDEAMRITFQSEKIYVKAGYYKTEIMEMCSTDAYLSGYIQHPIYSIYPNVGEESDLYE